MLIRFDDQPIIFDFTLQSFNDCVNNLITGWEALIKKNSDVTENFTEVILKCEEYKCSFLVKNRGLYVIDFNNNVIRERIEKSPILVTRDYGQIETGLNFHYKHIKNAIKTCSEINANTNEYFWKSNKYMAVILVLISEAARFDMLRYCIIYSLYLEKINRKIEVLNKPKYVKYLFEDIYNQEYSLNELDPEILKFTNISVLIHKYDDIRGDNKTRVITFCETHQKIVELINSGNIANDIDVCRLQLLGVLENPFRTENLPRKYSLEPLNYISN